MSRAMYGEVDDIDWLAPMERAPSETQEEAIVAVADDESGRNDFQPTVYALPHPSKRSRAEHLLAASRMREKRAWNLCKKRERMSQQTLAFATETVQKHGMLSRNEKITAMSSIKCIGVVVTRGMRGHRRGFTFASMLRMAFSGLKRTKDVARVFKCTSRWVRKVKMVVADALWMALVAFLQALASYAAATPPSVPAAELCWGRNLRDLVCDIATTSPSSLSVARVSFCGRVLVVFRRRLCRARQVAVYDCVATSGATRRRFRPFHLSWLIRGSVRLCVQGF